LQIGFDGLSIAISRKNKQDWNLTEREIFLALAAEVPDESGKKLIPNPNQTWNQINPKLPNVKIEVLGPPPTSGTRDAFVELTMHDGCDAIPDDEGNEEVRRASLEYRLQPYAPGRKLSSKPARTTTSSFSASGGLQHVGHLRLLVPL
jgi:ABC-type phosphate transport system substrate-binding protein